MPAELLIRLHHIDHLGPRGVTFERWITPREAADDLVVLARLN